MNNYRESNFFSKQTTGIIGWFKSLCSKSVHNPRRLLEMKLSIHPPPVDKDLCLPGTGFERLQVLFGRKTNSDVIFNNIQCFEQNPRNLSQYPSVIDGKTTILFV